MLQNSPMPIELRPALDHNFEYCRRLYFVEMRWIIEELHLDGTAQETSFRQQWNPTEVRMIALDGTDVGWLQAITQDDGLFVAQMFVDGPFQRRGIGTEVMKRLIGEANEFNLAVRLNVFRINPARRLYERLGFRVIHEDDRKFYMKRDPDAAGK
jgi:GNAT superfamily N-acetyltransferase